MGLVKFRLYYFLVASVNGVFGMAMPLYYGGLGYSHTQSALLMTIPSLVMLLQPAWGIIVDKYQKPKEIAIFGLISSAFMLVLLMWVESYYLVLVIIFIYALLKMPVWSTVDNIIVTYCMNNNKSYGTLRVFASAAWGSSLLIFLPLINIFGFKAYFLASLIINLLVAYIVLKFPNDVKLKETTNNNLTFSQGLMVLLKSKEFYFIILFTLFFSAMFVTNLVYQNIYLEELQVNKVGIALITFLSILPEFFILPVIEKFLHKKTAIFWLVFACVIYLVRFLGIAISHQVWIVILMAPLHGIGISFYIPVFIKYLKISVPANVSTTAITINALMAAISGIIMNVLAGKVWNEASANYVYYLNVLTIIAALIVLIMYHQYLKRVTISI
ncbi:MAG: MFS transporter [Mycoplasmatales bacterium]